MVSTIALWFVRQFGLAGCLVAGLLVFYEGLPGINYVTPILRVIPGVGDAIDDLAQGKVGRARLEGYASGQWGERQQWLETQKRWEDRARTEIAKIEGEYLSARRQDRDAMLALQRQQSDEAAQQTPPRPDCPPAVSPGVSVRLDAIGRNGVGPVDPSKFKGALR